MITKDLKLILRKLNTNRPNMTNKDLKFWEIEYQLTGMTKELKIILGN